MSTFTGTGAQILAECLVRNGIEHIFGLPGDTGVTFYDALYERADKITHVLVRDERHAAFMGDAYARTTNRIGVVEASSGGGVTYLVSGLGEPFAASVPMLVITSDIHRRSRNTGALTEIDQTKLFSAVTKWSAMVEHAADIPRLLITAITQAVSDRPAPVSLVLPEDVLDEHATVQIETTAISVPREREMTQSVGLVQAAQWLSQAQSPAIVAGSGVHMSQAWGELAELAEMLGAPIATSIHGKGAVDETGDWSLGVAGANGAREYANDYLASADVVLFVGTRANSTDTNSFKSPPRGKTKIIQIDITAERAGRNFAGSIGLAGDAKTVLLQLLDSVQPHNDRAIATRRNWLAQQRTAWAEQFDHSPALPDGQLNPRDVMRTALRLAGGDTYVVGEPGTPTPNIASYWEVSIAQRRVVIPRGHGAMGYVIPAAIGTAIAHPNRTVLAFTADGSFAMACGELETAARLNLPIIYFQFTNRSFGWIKMLQHLYSGKRYFGVEPGPIDAVKVAEGMGVHGVRVTTLDQLEHVMSEALQSRKPTYIDIPVPDQIHLVPPVAPWQAALAGNANRPIY
jgi:acetolactate synthase-1/2/3 large subunit